MRVAVVCVPPACGGGGDWPGAVGDGGLSDWKLVPDSVLCFHTHPSLYLQLVCKKNTDGGDIRVAFLGCGMW